MIEKLVAGLAVTIIGTLLIYAFKIKQLYLVVPRLFSSSLLSDNEGKIVEVRIFNRGRNAEVDVQVTLDPGVSYEIVAATDSTSSINSSIISVPRVPPGDDYSVLLLVEGGVFTNERISGVSSLTTKGKIIKELGDVPLNVGKTFLGLLAFLLLSAIPIAGIEGYQAWEKSKKHAHFVELTNALDQSWGGLEEYAESDFAKYYSSGEFPIHLLEKHRSGKRVVLKFRLINRAAAPLKVVSEVDILLLINAPKTWNYTEYESKTVPPGSTGDIEVNLFWPKGEVQETEIIFYLSVGAEKFIKAITHVEIDV